MLRHVFTKRLAVLVLGASFAMGDEIDLGDIAAGGTGLGTAAFVGVDASTGLFVAETFDGTVGNPASTPQAVLAPPGQTYDLIDSVFVLNGDVPITTSGVRYGDTNWITPTNPYHGATFDYILNALEPGDARPMRLRVGGQTVEFDRGVGVHASAGITFDLHAIAALHGTSLISVRTLFGTQADFIVRRWSTRRGRRTDVAHRKRSPRRYLRPTARRTNGRVTTNRRLPRAPAAFR